MDTSPALDAALATDGVTFFLCGKAELPAYTLRLLGGDGEVEWSEGTFVGRDDTFGVIGSIEAISDGVGDQAPQLTITFLPPSEASSAALSSPDMQGSPLKIWLGALDLATKTVIAEPYLLLDLVLDQPVLSIDKSAKEIAYECVSGFERLFMQDEGLRLSDASHQDYWPGETGLIDMTGIVKTIIWGPGEKIAGNSSFGTDGGGSYVDGGGFGGGGGFVGRAASS